MVAEREEDVGSSRGGRLCCCALRAQASSVVISHTSPPFHPIVANLHFPCCLLVTSLLPLLLSVLLSFFKHISYIAIDTSASPHRRPFAVWLHSAVTKPPFATLGSQMTGSSPESLETPSTPDANRCLRLQEAHEKLRATATTWGNGAFLRRPLIMATSR